MPLATSTLCLFLQENPLVKRAGGRFASRECGHGQHRLQWTMFNGAYCCWRHCRKLIN